MMRVIRLAGCVAASAVRYLFEPWYGAHAHAFPRLGECLPGPQRAA